MIKKPIKRIVQMLPILSGKDAIGEEAMLMDKTLRAMGFESEIVTLNLDLRRPERSETWDQTLVLYHYSIGSRLPYYLLEWKAPLILRYHNITPVSFFNGHAQEELSINACQLGLQQMPLLVKMSSHFLPVSEYNAQALQRAGAKDIFTIPILRDYSRFENASVHNKTSSTQFLFVGRLSPNKCQHDLIEILDLYKRFMDPSARLVLVGGGFSSVYSKSLVELARRLHLKIGFDLASKDTCDVTFLKDLSEEELAKLYHESSLFISMSEHEGFCVPLVEAMCAELPILAHRAAAIPETLSNAGVLVDKSDKADVLRKVESLVKDTALRQSFLERAKERSKIYSLGASSELLKRFFGSR